MPDTTSQKPQKISLGAKKREVFGKRLKKIRRDGKLPANVFGPGFTSLSIELDLREFSKVFSKAHETGIIYLAVDGQEIPALARQVQRHPLTHGVLHVDFRKVDLAQKIETEVPVKVIGESPASEKGGVLLTLSDHLLVESLPEDIPQEIEIDVSHLTEIGNEIKVSDIKVQGKYQIKDESEKVVLSITAHKEESIEPEVAAPAVAEGEEAAEPAEGAEVEAAGEATEAPAEGEEKKKGVEEKPAEGKKAEKKEEK